MKKLFVLAALLLGISVCANAQDNSTKAVPISNGCGSENSVPSQVGSWFVNPIDAAKTGTSIKQQKESCDQHDKDYYNGVNKQKADRDLEIVLPLKGQL